MEGSAPTNEAFAGDIIGLCTEACVTSDEVQAPYTAELAHSTGEFRLGPVGSATYRVAVAYGTLDEGGRLDYRAGYLRRVQDGSYVVVDTFSRGTAFDLTRSTTLAALTVRGAEPKAEPAYPTAQVVPMGDRVKERSFALTFKAARVEPGTTVRTVIVGCGGKLAAVKRFTSTGTFSYTIGARYAAVPRTAVIKHTVSQPGRLTRTMRMTYGPLPGSRC